MWHACGYDFLFVLYYIKVFLQGKREREREREREGRERGRGGEP